MTHRHIAHVNKLSVAKRGFPPSHEGLNGYGIQMIKEFITSGPPDSRKPGEASEHMKRIRVSKAHFNGNDEWQEITFVFDNVIDYHMFSARHG